MVVVDVVQRGQEKQRRNNLMVILAKWLTHWTVAPAVRVQFSRITPTLKGEYGNRNWGYC